MDNLKDYLDSLSHEELEAYIKQSELNSLRQLRNDLLAKSDWMVMPDRTPTQAQLEYRQALRDITKTYTSLTGVSWPVLEEA
jgi:hypothetical protein